jgi:hypothetical protein
MKKVIYSSLSRPFWLDVAFKLREKSDWMPVYWLARPEQEAKIRACFSDMVFHSTLDAIKGIPSPDFNPQTYIPIDTQVYQEFSMCQLTALKMMDRIDALGSLDYHDRIRLFNFQLRYWMSVLNHIEPDLVVFATIPHLVFDYILYELCNAVGIKTLMFESTPMMGLTFLMEDFDGISKTELLYKKLLTEKSDQDIKLSPDTLAYIRTLRGTYSDLPDYARRAYNEELPKLNKSALKTPFWRKFLDIKRYPQYIEKQRRIITNRLEEPQNYLKKSNRKLEHSSLSRLEYEVFRWKAARKMRQLEAYYLSIATSVDLKQPYVYVALSFQPERTSSPMGSIYVNQLLMVDLLLQSLPSGWQIYVKEHPTQFTASKYYRSQSSRTKDFYDDLAALPKVNLVPMEVDSFGLIDHSKATATLTGSVGWEAVHRGRPVLLFGYPWYRGCEGTFLISDQTSCLDAFEKIQAGFQIDSTKLDLFAYALEQTGLKAYVEPHLRVHNISDEENANRIVRALQQAET